MKKIIIQLLICAFTLPLAAQNPHITTALTSHFNTKAAPGQDLSVMDIKRHAMVKVPDLNCPIAPYWGPGVVSFYNEENRSTWAIFNDIDGYIRRSMEIQLGSVNGVPICAGCDQTFHITAAKLRPLTTNEIVFTGKIYNPGTGAYHLMAGEVEICDIVNAIPVNVRVSDLENTEGTALILNPSNPNEFVIVGAYNTSGNASNNELVVATYDYTISNIINLQHHEISFNADDLTPNLTNGSNIIISGMSNYVGSHITPNNCGQPDYNDISATLIDYEVPSFAIVDMKSYSSYQFFDRIRNKPLSNGNAYFMIEGFTNQHGIVEYFGTTAIWDRVSNTQNARNYTAGLITFDDALDNTGFEQFDLTNYRNDGLRNANLIYIGDGQFGPDMLGVSLRTIDYSGSFGVLRQALITTPVYASTPFGSMKAKRKTQNNGAALGLGAALEYKNMATTIAYDQQIYTAIATYNSNMPGTNEHYVHQSSNILDNIFAQCNVRIDMDFLPLCTQFIESDRGDDQGSSYTSSVAAATDKIPVIGDNALCTSAGSLPFRKKESTLGEDREEDGMFNFFPNPAKNQLNIEFDNDEQASVTVLDLTGRIILQEVAVNKQLNINVSELPKGTYMLRVEQKGVISNKKWMKY